MNAMPQLVTITRRRAADYAWSLWDEEGGSEVTYRDALAAATAALVRRGHFATASRLLSGELPLRHV